MLSPVGRQISRRCAGGDELGDHDRVNPAEQFELAVEAESSVAAWSTGAQMLALVSALRDRGWMSFLHEPRDLSALAEFSGLSVSRVQDIVAVLKAHDVVSVNEQHVRLTPSFHAFSSDNSFLAFDDTLDNALVMQRMVVEPVALSEEDALAVARAAGGRPSDVSRAMYGHLFTGQLGEVGALIRNGRWLDVGCGVASASLTLATLWPEVRITALELSRAIAAEATRRAAGLGVAGRVDVRCVDARDFDERDVFVGAFWAQPFFPEDTRAATLSMILRALRPGGQLVLQEMDSEPEGDAVAAYSLRRLVYQGWGVPFGRTAEKLAGEAEAVGFEFVRMAPTDFGRFVILRKPDVDPEE